MSMFHELMMRKKEEIMYATIKGTLTENDGVFSGFSASNYLALQQTLDTSKSFEVVIKVRYVGDSNKYFFGKIGYSITVGTTTVDSNRRFKAFFSSNGTSWNIGNITTTVNLTTNTDYYVKVGFTGTKYYIEQSTDGKNYVGLAELNSSENIISGNLLLGKSYLDEQYWTGSIDLNQSYIKLGSTKYNLQAVVGYTIVGSPTITDGVVSGFSSSNYLTLPSITDESFKGKIRVKANTTLTGYDGIIYLSSDGKNFVVEFNGVTSARLYCYDETTSSNVVRSIWSAFSAETWYDIYFDYDKENKTMVISFKDTSQNLIAEVVYNNASLNGGSFIFGYTWNALDGSIDIINSYIYKSNKLWFNGQQA